MPKLLSSARVVKVLTREGFIFISQRGSHAKFRKGPATVIVPMAKKEIPHGTLRSIIRQSGLAPEAFKK
ncbi:hypothetical protein A3A68_01475 [Candidatus Saccharibacteria bacterium RIFCSPLOWO2_01_FULL_48_13]|nr:MAG: hypothetical protein A3A68_01475 [Candidatus Saccharibacteria bacterium RIFCSPLOWO2_01_FULL_48_13]